MDEQPRPEQVSRYLDVLQKQFENEQARRLAMENEMTQSSGSNPLKDPNLVEYQLDVKELIDEIFHLLSAHQIKINGDGSEYWDEPDDDRLKIFSSYGVKQIMILFKLYIDRTTLLSNFPDVEIINETVYRFGIEINDAIFNRIESFLDYPTPEDLFDKYKVMVREQNLDITDDELYTRCLDWSLSEFQRKVSLVPPIVWALIHKVHATYLRALGGKERQSLRERLNINQSANQFSDTSGQTPQQSKFYNPKTW